MNNKEFNGTETQKEYDVGLLRRGSVRIKRAFRSESHFLLEFFKVKKLQEVGSKQQNTGPVAYTDQPENPTGLTQIMIFETII